MKTTMATPCPHPLTISVSLIHNMKMKSRRRRRRSRTRRRTRKQWEYSPCSVQIRPIPEISTVAEGGYKLLAEVLLDVRWWWIPKGNTQLQEDFCGTALLF